MKNIIKNFTLTIIIFTTLLISLLNNSIVKDELLITINNFYNYLLPSLIIFLLLGELLSNYGFIELLSILFYPIKRIFKISENKLYIILMSILSGCPANAKYTKDLYNNNYISLKEANNILIYSYFSNIIYMITILFSLLSNRKYILIIVMSHYLSNLILLFIYNDKNYMNTSNSLKSVLGIKRDFSTILLNAVKNTLKIVLNTFVIICFFSIIISVIKIIFKNDILLIGLIEITNGMYELSKLSNEYIISILSLLFLSFGGLSIHFQIKSVLKNTQLDYKYFLYGRILQSLLSIFIFVICTW